MQKVSKLRSLHAALLEPGRLARAIERVRPSRLPRPPGPSGRGAAAPASDPAQSGAAVRPAEEFLTGLRQELLQHVAVNHPLLVSLDQVPYTREDYRIFGLQHYALVGTFTTYLEHLLLRAPDSHAKQWLAKVLVDEYGEGSDGKDHAELYRGFLRATGSPEGEEYQTPLHGNVTDFIAEHLRICREEPFLVGLGAVGPGHEWSIPAMFERIIRGLGRTGFEPDEILYFTLHIGQDVDHGAWLESALARYATTAEAQQQIRRGALLSLEARNRFWTGVQDKLASRHQAELVHGQVPSKRLLRRAARRSAGELTLSAWKQKLTRAGIIAATHT